MDHVRLDYTLLGFRNVPAGVTIIRSSNIFLYIHHTFSDRVLEATVAAPYVSGPVI